MNYENRTFVVFNVSELNLIDFSQVLETSSETVRKSLDGQKTFVKWEGDQMPQCIADLTTKETPYTYDEILDMLSTPDWNPIP